MNGRTLSYNQALFSEQRRFGSLYINCGTLGVVPQHTKNLLILLTCQSVLGLKESTEASFHIGQTALILLGSLLLQVNGCKLQLLKTEEKVTE